MLGANKTSFFRGHWGPQWPAILKKCVSLFLVRSQYQFVTCPDKNKLQLLFMGAVAAPHFSPSFTPPLRTVPPQTVQLRHVSFSLH